MIRAQTERPDRRTLAVLAALTLAPFILLGVWARFGSPAPWEPEILIAFARQPGPPGDVVATINTLGNLPIWAVVVALTAAVTGFIRGVVAAILVALSFASDAAAFVTKLLVERDRPETAAVEQVFGYDTFSYPSGHTVRAAAFVAVALWLFAPPRWRLHAAVVGGLVAGIVMGYARVSLGVHWPTDSVGGTLLGLGWFAVTALLVGVTLPSRSATMVH